MQCPQADTHLESINQDRVIESDVNKNGVQAFVLHSGVPRERSLCLFNLRFDGASDSLVKALREIQVADERSCKCFVRVVVLVSRKSFQNFLAVDCKHKECLEIR